MSVSNILSTDTRTNNWKNLHVGDIVCKSINSDTGITADAIRCVDVIPIKQTAPTGNQALIYNASTEELEFMTLIDNTGITTLNGCSGLIQSFATATDPINGFQIVSDSGTNTHTFKIGDAEPGKRGFVSAGAQSFSGAKTFLGDVNTGSNVLYSNNIMNASGSEILVTTPKITLSNSDGAYIAKIKSTDAMTFTSGGILQNGTTPQIQAVSRGTLENAYILGVSPYGNTDKHCSLGYNATTDRGQIYAWDQASGVRNLQLGFYGFACEVHASGGIWANENRRCVTGYDGSSSLCVFAAIINGNGSVAVSTPGIVSVSRILGGVYQVQFAGSQVYGVSVAITEVGQCGFITAEYLSATLWQVVIRAVNGVTLRDLQFTIKAISNY